MDETPKLKLIPQHAGDVLVVEVVGNLVVGVETKHMREEMEKVFASGSRKILLNLARVSYMDSTGIGVLLGAKTSALNRKLQMKVCCLPSFAARLLAQLHLTKILDVYDQQSAALESFEQVERRPAP